MKIVKKIEILKNVRNDSGGLGVHGNGVGNDFGRDFGVFTVVLHAFGDQRRVEWSYGGPIGRGWGGGRSDA